MLEKDGNSEVHVEKLEQRPTGSIAFGLERLGLIAVQAPIVSCIVLAALIVGAIFGIERIKIDDSLSQLFRSNSKEYRQYEAETKRFPATEFDVLVVVEGKTLLARENLERMRELVTDLQLVEGTRGLISLFSARQAPAPGKLPAALFPSDLPTGAEYEKFIETVKTNEIIRGKLLSEDGTLALIVLSLEPEIVASNKLGPTVREIPKLMASDLSGSGLKAELSGVPVMQLEIRNAVERDGLTYNVLGILAGCIIAIIFFRKISFMVVAAFPPMIAILLALGGLGWANFNLNMFLKLLTPLIMVISFSDSMQLTFAARDRLIAGQDKYTAFRNAILVVGPACVLTHGTAGISFIALQLSDSDLIRQSDGGAVRIPPGRFVVCAGDAAGDRAGPRHVGGAGGRWECLVAGDAAALACGKSWKCRRRDVEGIRQFNTRASGKAVHFRQSGCGGGIGPGSGSGFKRNSARCRKTRSGAGHCSQGASRVRDRRYRPLRHRGAQQRQHDR